MKGLGQIEDETNLEQSQQQNQCQDQQEESFVWDENSQLYYHARSGFYHDPNAGWYYSTRDGLYYKFEDGNYILLDSYKGDQPDTKDQGESLCATQQLEATFEQGYNPNDDQNEGQGDQIGFREGISSEVPENPPPPSEWLEDTLIELYLSGYSNAASNAADDLLLPDGTVERDSSLLSVDGNIVQQGKEESEWNLDQHAAADSSEDVLYEGASQDEENWRAQYGQVVPQEAELGQGFPVVDMWDWSLVKDIQKDGNPQVVRVVGRLVQPSSKLHPSVPSSGGRLRTAAICRTHLDLVQVRSGQVYKLRTPSAGHLATLSSYDASNPTKDWGFPELSVESTSESCVSRTAVQVSSQQNMCSYPNKPSDHDKQTSDTYRDRAAERRALHGGFGVAPGQKRSAEDANPPSPPDAEDAAAEALEMSFGARSYAQKILKNMGWKEGEALGKTQRGLTEPLQGVGNKGTAGLGWDNRRRK